MSTRTVPPEMEQRLYKYVIQHPSEHYESGWYTTWGGEWHRAEDHEEHQVLAHQALDRGYSIREPAARLVLVTDIKRIEHRVESALWDVPAEVPR